MNGFKQSSIVMHCECKSLDERCEYMSDVTVPGSLARAESKQTSF